MKRILIHGLKDPVGGVETAVMAYASRFDPEKVRADFTVFGADFSLEPAIRAQGGRVLYLPDRIRDRAAYKKTLTRIFTETRYDAVWCNFSGLTNLDLLTYAKKAGVPVRVAHAHTASLSWGSPMMKYPVWLFHTVNKQRLSSVATHLWTCSARAARFMFAGHAGEAQLIPNAADPARFAFDPALRATKRREWGFEETDLVVGHVGRMCREKNQRFLLEIFAALAAENENAKLLFVGDGELREEVKACAAGLLPEGRVVFTGNRTDVAELLNAMDVFFLPSLSEGFPVTLTEAQINGLPCVASAEAVDPQVNFSGSVRFVPLSADAAVWTRTLREAAAAGRDPQGAEKARLAGFTAREAAERLQAFFTGNGT